MPTRTSGWPTPLDPPFAGHSPDGLVLVDVRVFRPVCAVAGEDLERQVQMVPPPLRQASRGQIRDALVIVFDKNRNDPPNMNKMCPLAKEELGQLGLCASNRQIQDVGDEPALKARRGPVGQKKKR